MVPLSVRIKLKRPMIEPLQLFHLDALLGALRVEVEELNGVAFNPRDVHHDLPLERFHSPAGEWVFKASAFRMNRLSETMSWMTSGRSNLIAAAEDRASGLLTLRASKPNTAGGPFKSTITANNIVWADLEAWAIGDEEGIKTLLAECTHIGGMRGTGFGNVASIEVAQVPEEDCPWYLRAMPADTPSDIAVRQNYSLAVGSLRSPYWDRQLHQEVLHPHQI